jgi:hypothetical protein
VIGDAYLLVRIINYSILNWPAHNMEANLETIAEISVVCNDAGISSQGQQFHATGISTEAALKVSTGLND